MEPDERQAEIERMKSSFVPFRAVEDLDLILFGEPKKISQSSDDIEVCQKIKKIKLNL